MHQRGDDVQANVAATSATTGPRGANQHIVVSTLRSLGSLKFTRRVFSTKDPVYREEEDAFIGWWGKTPLGRRKQRATEMELEAKLEKETGEKKGKKKK